VITQGFHRRQRKEGALEGAEHYTRNVFFLHFIIFDFYAIVTHPRKRNIIEISREVDD
jgi:hypothetical protein